MSSTKSKMSPARRKACTNHYAKDNFDVAIWFKETIKSYVKTFGISEPCARRIVIDEVKKGTFVEMDELTAEENRRVVACLSFIDAMKEFAKNN